MPREPTVYERGRVDGRLLEIRRTPMPDGGFVLTITDMTKRAEAEQVLREATKMQAIGQLTGGTIVHHGRLDDGVNLIAKPFKHDGVLDGADDLAVAGRSAMTVPLR